MHCPLFFWSRLILISCQSFATLTKSTSLFQFVDSNLCKQVGGYLQSAAAVKPIYIYIF